MSEGESSSVFLSTPQRIGALEAFAVHSAAVGSAHAVAVVAEGSLAAWGCNEFGQLGENHHLCRSCLCPASMSETYSDRLAALLYLAAEPESQTTVRSCSRQTFYFRTFDCSRIMQDTSQIEQEDSNPVRSSVQVGTQSHSCAVAACTRCIWDKVFATCRFARARG